MGDHYPTKSFKSGNSVAIRMPAALEVEPDKEWIVAKQDGKIVIEAKDAPKRKFDIDAIWGIAKGTGLRPIAPEDRVFEERSLPWDDPDWRAEHMPDA